MNLLATNPTAPLTPLAIEGPVVVAQLGQSLDGRIATATGASKYISGFEALRHLHRLRAEVDAVLVGVGTLIADDPALTVRHVDGRHPTRVVIDPDGRAPETARIMGDGAADVICVTRPGAAVPRGARGIALNTGADGRFAPAAIIAALRDDGLDRLLVEGGADTLAGFIDAGAVDLLHVLVAPIILGSGKAGFSLQPIDQLDEAIRPPTTVHLFNDGDVLFTCDLRKREARGASLATEGPVRPNTGERSR
ncbi:RibD family protein [Pikeienuella piscinae]|uniref:RibD family protein n=1 Tax=Pikeienuella piscinae TaxID=2748098 RepID=A0A7L5BY20_9RHOB|nr:RibD family protein [Pikeienuella piscinae]QIE54794.1 RibD family protein [Pikeienuella piscinae]